MDKYRAHAGSVVVPACPRPVTGTVSTALARIRNRSALPANPADRACTAKSGCVRELAAPVTGAAHRRKQEAIQMWMLDTDYDSRGVSQLESHVTIMPPSTMLSKRATGVCQLEPSRSVVRPPSLERAGGRYVGPSIGSYLANSHQHPVGNRVPKASDTPDGTVRPVAR